MQKPKAETRMGETEMLKTEALEHRQNFVGTN
jgi:hypothetical protein